MNLNAIIEKGAALTAKQGKYMPSVIASRKVTKKMNLGENNIDDNTPKFSRLTGVGFAFEELVQRKLESQGKNVERCPEDVKNGSDLIVDGEPVQCKCNITGKGCADAVYHGLQLRYPDQTLLVPADKQEICIKELENKSKNGLDVPPKVKSCGVTYQDAVNYLHKGKRSFLMDCCDRRLMKVPMIEGLVVAGIGLFASFHNHKEKSKSEIALQCLGSVAAGVTVFACGLFFGAVDRQNRRSLDYPYDEINEVVLTK